MRKIYIKFIGLITFLLFSSASNIFAADISVTTSTTWSTLVPIPTSTDNVFVKKGAVLTINVSNAICNQLYLGGSSPGGDGTITFDSGTSLTVTSNLYFGAVSGSNIYVGNINMSLGGTLTVGGNIITTGTGLGTFTPGAGTVIYNGTGQKIIPTTYNNLTISGNDTITAASSVTVGNFLTVNGTLTLKSDATGTANLLASSYLGSGTIRVERYVPANRWYIVSSPVVNDSLARFGSSYAAVKTARYAIAPYAESSDSWAYINTTGNTAHFASGQGYTFFPAAITPIPTFTGKSINTGNVSVNVTKNGNGWNAIGNPYTSSINLATFLTDNSAQINPSYAGAYIWDGSIGDYSVTSTGNIAVGQGFIIRAAATGTVQFNAAQQVAAPTSGFKSSEIPEPSMILSVASGKVLNQTIINFASGATEGLDPSLDLGKLKGNPEIALFTKLVDGTSNVDFAVQALPNEDFEKLVIPVGLDLLNGGETAFTLKTNSFPENAQVFLVDKYTNARIELSIEDAAYNVNLPALSGSDRFELEVVNFKSGETTTGVNISDEIQQLNVFSRKGQIVINGKVDQKTTISVYGIDGRIRYQSRANHINQNVIDASAYPNGIYIVRIEQPGQTQTTKVILNK